MNSFPHKLFDLKQPAKKVSPEAEIAVLRELLSNSEFKEDYELCATILYRLKEVETEIIYRSSSRKQL